MQDLISVAAYVFCISPDGPHPCDVDWYYYSKRWSRHWFIFSWRWPLCFSLIYLHASARYSSFTALHVHCAWTWRRDSLDWAPGASCQTTHSTNNSILLGLTVTGWLAGEGNLVCSLLSSELWTACSLKRL